MTSKRQSDIKAGKKKYKKELEYVINELNELDPIGLHAAEAPWDEYSPEAQVILAAAKRAKNHVELQRAMNDIFKKQFGLQEDHMALFRKSAKKIFKEVRYS